jgi:hypothetical protein
LDRAGQRLRFEITSSNSCIKLRAGGSYDSETLKKPILGFVFDEKGQIGDISLKGSKIKKIEPT